MCDACGCTPCKKCGKPVEMVFVVDAKRRPKIVPARNRRKSF